MTFAELWDQARAQSSSAEVQQRFVEAHFPGLFTGSFILHYDPATAPPLSDGLLLGIASYSHEEGILLDQLLAAAQHRKFPPIWVFDLALVRNPEDYRICTGGTAPAYPASPLLVFRSTGSVVNLLSGRQVHNAIRLLTT
jgi:hypothetical protein